MQLQQLKFMYFDFNGKEHISYFDIERMKEMKNKRKKWNESEHLDNINALNKHKKKTF